MCPRSARQEETLAQRYNPQAAHDTVLKNLETVAVDAYVADGNTKAYVAAMRAAREEAERAAAAERARAKNWRDLRAVVLRNDECHYCGEFATQVDHIVPYSRGGADTLDNLVPACESCNMEKLDFTVDEWRQYRLTNGDCWPPEGFNARLRRIVAETMERYA